MKMLSSKIKNKMRPVMQHAAAQASRHVERLSPATKKIAVIVFCVLFSALSICIIAKTLSGKDKKIFFIRPWIMPVHLRKNLRIPQPYISDEAYQRIEMFKKYLDSNSITDKKAFYQIITARPHLMDSIIMFEKLYRSQSKKH
jgi:hypothetical protein